MDTTVKKRVLMALHSWLKNHPAPDATVLQLAGGIDLSPREIVRHVQAEDKIGQLQLDVIQHAMERYGTDEVIHGLRGRGTVSKGSPP